MSAVVPTNLLFLFSDQHTRLAHVCMEHPVVKTPRLDAFAERGSLRTPAPGGTPLYMT